MRSSLIAGSFVLAFSLACGASDAPPTPDLVPVPVPVPAPDPAPAPAPDPVAAATRCTKDVYSAGLWQGEYPGPVLDIQAPVTVPARTDACAGATDTTCTIAKGVYHPWADPQHGRYATLRPITRFKVLRDFETVANDPKVHGKVAIAAGKEIEILAYFGEGFCQWRFEGVLIEDQCPEMLDDDAGPRFEEIPGTGFTEVQVLGVDCAEGHPAWIDVDEDFLALPAVGEGTIRGYGEVGPGGAAP